MTGSHSRNKGRRGELEWARFVGGRRANDEGLSGHDVESRPLTIWPGLETYEVKRPAKLTGQLRTFIEQMVKEDADALAFREDRGRWYLIIDAERLDR